MLLSSLNELKGDELETTLLEPLDDLSNESTLDTIGLEAKGVLNNGWRTESRMSKP